MRTLLKLVILSSVALLGAGCATPENQEVAANLEGKVVNECRYAKATGSKMRTRICYPQETWAAIDARNAKDQDNDAFFRRSREMSTTAGNVSVPSIGGGGGQ